MTELSKDHIKITINPGECDAGYIMLDFYRLIRNMADQFGVRLDPAVEHSLKKILRLGRGDKSAVQDALEAANQLMLFIEHEQSKGKS